MAEADDAIRESEQARRRLTELANEIGRRATADHVREEARTLVREKTDDVRALASEKGREWTAQAKETAVNKSIEYRDKALGSPTFLGIVGALLGGLVGRSVAKSGRLVGNERGIGGRSIDTGMYGGASTGVGYGSSSDVGIGSSGYVASGYGSSGYGSTGLGTSGIPPTTVGTGISAGMSSPDVPAGGMSGAGMDSGEVKADVKQRAGEAVDLAREKLGEVSEKVADTLSSAKETVSMQADRMRQSLPSAHDVKVLATNTWRDQPWAVAAGAIGFGLLAALFLPVSDKERRIIEPMRSKARDQLRDVGRRIEEQVSSDVDSRHDGSGASVAGSGIEGGGIEPGGFVGTGSIVSSGVGEDVNEDERRGEQTFQPPTVH